MNSNVKNPKRQRALRWLGYGLLLKLALVGGAWLFAATAQQIMTTPLDHFRTMISKGQTDDSSSSSRPCR